jgi:hypothetical protein
LPKRIQGIGKFFGKLVNVIFEQKVGIKKNTKVFDGWYFIIGSYLGKEGDSIRRVFSGVVVVNR